MKRKVVAAAMAAALTVSMLSGCGSSGSTSSDGGADNAASNSSDGAIELTVWHYFEEPDVNVINALVEEYNSIQDDVHITATYVSREELMNQYTIGAVSGDLPDIGMVDSPDMASYISLGVFADITDNLNSWGELDHFYDGNLASCMDADGKIYGLPHNTNCISLICNMDLLEKAGYDHVPDSIEEFEKMALDTTDAADGTYGFAMCAVSTEEGTFQLLPWLQGTQNGKSTTVADIAADSAVAGLSVLGNLTASGAMSTECVNWTQSDVYNQFVAQKAAMAEIGTWHLPLLKEDVTEDDFKYQVCLLPTGDKGTSTSTVGGENFGVCSSTEHKEEAAEFIEWMCSVDNQKKYSEEGGKLPTRDDVSPEYSFLQDEFAVFQEQLQTAAARGPHESWPTISKSIYTMAQDVFLNGADSAASLQKAADTIKPILEETPILEY